MQRVPHRVTVYGLAALLGLGTTRAAAAQAAVTGLLSDASAVTKVETVHRTEHRSKAPNLSAEAVWVPGFWDFRESPQRAPRAGWVWVPGIWLEPPPVPGARWDPGHWDWGRGWYTWIPSHWVVPEHRGFPTQSPDDETTRFEMSAP